MRICYGSAAGKILNAGVYENFVFLLCLGFVHANRPISCVVSMLANSFDIYPSASEELDKG